jgi:hypothetical protein
MRGDDNCVCTTPEIHGKLMRGDDNCVCTTPEIHGKLMRGDEVLTPEI